MLLLISFVASLAFVTSILTLYLFRVYKRQQIIKKMERQLVAPKEKKFSILEMLGYNDLVIKTQNIISNVGLNLDAENFLFTVLLLDTLAVAGSIILQSGYWGLVIVFGTNFALFYLLNDLAERKKRKRVLQFAEAAQDIADYLKVNNNLLNAIEKTVDSIENPLRRDFEKIVTKVYSGISLMEALKDFARESESPIIETWVDSMIFSTRMKADISQTSEIISTKIRKRIMQNRKIQALMMQTKSTVYAMILVMSIVMIGTILNTPDYMKILQAPTGKMAIAYTATSYFLTALYIFRKIDKMVGSV
ncbi:type II secretion system F family protein [Caldanaerobacter subterraneus]|uniref:Tight adherence protein B n=1 Tax=Caldanaerobacter subterraneus TaxID=911092 RepID=A0A4R2JHF8_9THEO|nr:type II secretion system F family protein [Caldanaerobacter subterraneus]TCO57782.1 tight adherence protein B [Caldanaerobacter subterraneus]